MESITVNDKEFIWSEKYRPQSIDECILPAEIKTPFQEFKKCGDIPHLILNGSSGTGKTTIAMATCQEMGLESYYINGSDEGRLMDTFRTTIKTFATSVSFSGKKKVIIVDEADYMNPESVQPALRSFMQEFSTNCSFIFTCNYKAKLIDALHSRCSHIEFRIRAADRLPMAVAFMKRVMEICEHEGVSYDKKVLAEIVKRYFPDYRRTLNELQWYSKINNGKIDIGLLSVVSDTSLTELIGHLKNKNFDAIRKWLVEKNDIEPSRLYRTLYDALHDQLDSSSVPEMIIVLADYQYRGAFVVDYEIHLMALFAEIMSNAKWKNGINNN